MELRLTQLYNLPMEEVQMNTELYEDDGIVPTDEVVVNISDDDTTDRIDELVTYYYAQ